jgi:hypothetical protein
MPRLLQSIHDLVSLTGAVVEWSFERGFDIDELLDEVAPS